MIIFLECIFVAILALVVLIVSLFIVSSLILFIKTKGGPTAPFIPLSQEALEYVTKQLVIKEDDVVYDLGCGDGRIIFALARHHTLGRFIGIERNTFVYYLARLRQKLFLQKAEQTRVRIIRTDIRDEIISDATHVITYLLPDVLDMILPKLKQELTKGTLLYSVDFMFSNKEPKEIIPLQGSALTLAKRIVVYEF
jgi:SAM-dependent methyltransferase